MRKNVKLILLGVCSLGLLVMANLMGANAGERQFFSGIGGSWSGPGEIVAGKYKGTKFNCKLNGHSIKNKIGMQVEGSCRIGVFSQPMSAKIMKSGRIYSGRFLDGEKGDGMDVTGGRFATSRFVVGLKRKNLKATMVARLATRNKLRVTISVDVNGKLVPVIGMALDRSNRVGQLN